MSNYIEDMKMKLEHLYNTLKGRYTDEDWCKHSPAAFTTLLEYIYVDNDTLTKENPYAATISHIIKLKMQNKPKLQCIYLLLRREDLWQALNALEVNPGYFIAVLADYVQSAGYLRNDFNETITKEWDFEEGDTCQRFFNQRVRDVIEALKVFYD